MATTKGEVKTVEQWAQEKGVSAPILSGLKVDAGWKTGKEVDEKSFDKALSAFCEAPADGRAK